MRNVPGAMQTNSILVTKAKDFGALFDIFNIFFLILAVVIFIMLRNALGRRTGHERPPYDPFSRNDQESDENVVPLPGARPPPAEGEETAGAPTAEEIEWDKFVKRGSPAFEGLAKIAQADQNFEPGQFIDGAKIAYEAIVTAFADGDRRTLRNLLSNTVFDGFDAAIYEREERGD